MEEKQIITDDVLEEPTAEPTADEPTETTDDSTTDEEELVVDLELVKDFLVTDEGKRAIQPLLDGFFHKGLETWKQKHLQGLIESEIERVQDPKELEKQELKKQIDRFTHLEKVSEKVRSSKKILPIELVDAFESVDTDIALQIIDSLVNEIKVNTPKVLKKKIDSRFGNRKGVK